MNPTKLRHRVAIQRATEATAATGEVGLTWSAVATVWASVKPLAGRELWQAQQVKAQVTHRVVLRYLPGLTTRDRLLHKGRVLQIDAVLNPDENTRLLELLCQETA